MQESNHNKSLCSFLSQLQKSTKGRQFILCPQFFRLEVAWLGWSVKPIIIFSKEYKAKPQQAFTMAFYSSDQSNPDGYNRILLGSIGGAARNAQRFRIPIIFTYRFKAMKKNVSKLIIEIAPGTKKLSNGAFKLTCRNVHKYVNKILVDPQEYNKPSSAQVFIKQQMNEYQTQVQQNIAALEENIRKKALKPITITYLVTQLELNLNVLAMQEVMTAIRFAKREEILEVRPKLIKLEDSLNFMLQEENLEPHLQEAIDSFLKDLNEVINKSTKIY